MNTERLLMMLRSQQHRVLETLKTAQNEQRDPLTRQLLELLIAELGEVKRENTELKKRITAEALKRRYKKVG